MTHRLLPYPRRAGFTLAEVAVTIVIVGIGLTLTLQGLNASQITAAHTRNMRLARELGLRTLGEIASGLWWDELTPDAAGSYIATYDDEPRFEGEIVLGDEVFREDGLQDEGTDTWSQRERWRDEQLASESTTSDEEETPTEPYEKVKVRVHFPKFQDLPDHLDLERWIPWEQVYGPDEEKQEGAAGSGSGAGSGAGSEAGE